MPPAAAAAKMTGALDLDMIARCVVVVCVRGRERYCCVVVGGEERIVKLRLGEDWMMSRRLEEMSRNVRGLDWPVLI